MAIINYYIEDLATGLVVTDTSEMIAYTPGCNAKAFSSSEEALAYIDTLSNGEYRIFSRITKS